MFVSISFRWLMGKMQAAALVSTSTNARNVWDTFVWRLMEKVFRLSLRNIQLTNTTNIYNIISFINTFSNTTTSNIIHMDEIIHTSEYLWQKVKMLAEIESKLCLLTIMLINHHSHWQSIALINHHSHYQAFGLVLFAFFIYWLFIQIYFSKNILPCQQQTQSKFEKQISQIIMIHPQPVLLLCTVWILTVYIFMRSSPDYSHHKTNHKPVTEMISEIKIY